LYLRTPFGSTTNGGSQLSAGVCVVVARGAAGALASVASTCAGVRGLLVVGRGAEARGGATGVRAFATSVVGATKGSELGTFGTGAAARGAVAAGVIGGEAVSEATGLLRLRAVATPPPRSTSAMAVAVIAQIGRAHV